MTVQNKTLINSQPTNQEACPGTNVTFKVIATGTNLQYQWQSEGVDIPGENDPTLVLSPVSVADEGLYRCVVTGDCGIVYSNPASLTVNEAINITSNPASQQICEGNNVNFMVNASGTSLVYQWRKNGVNLSDNARVSGSQTKTLSIANAAITERGV